MVELKKGMDSIDKTIERAEELGVGGYDEGRVFVCCNDDIVEEPGNYPSSEELIYVLSKYHDTSAVRVGDYMGDGCVERTYRPVLRDGEIDFVEDDTEPTKLEGDVLFVRGMNYNLPPSERNFEEQMRRLGSFDVDYYINSPDGQSFLELKENYIDKLDNVPLPETYNFEDIYELMEVLDDKGKLVGKPRIGGQGTGVKRLQKEEHSDENCLREFFEGEIENYAFQELVKQEEKERERRFIFLNDEEGVYGDYMDRPQEIVASREILDRDRPWDPEEKILKKVRRLHEPEEEEVEIVENVFEQVPEGTKFGCVDMLVDDEDEKFVIEMNGSGTGLFGDSKEAGSREWGERYYNLTPHMVNYVSRLIGD